jgi:hypothetical protein
MPAIDPNESPLAMLDPHEKPDVHRLLADVRTSLNAAQAAQVFDRMVRNHEARYTIVDPITGVCRRPTRRDLAEFSPETRPEDIFPFPGAAANYTKLVDHIINQHVDLLLTAGDEARRSILPAGRDALNEERMQRAEDWGTARDDVLETVEADMDDAVTQWVDWAWEYGFGVIFLGFKFQKQLDKREIVAEDVRQMLMSAVMEEAEAQRMAADQARGITHAEIVGEGEDAQESLLSPDEQMQLMAMVDLQFEEMLFDTNVNRRLVPLLQQFDAEMPKSEARRVAVSLRKGEEACYYVPTVKSAAPDIVRLRPGINFWCPMETKRIRNAPLVMTAELLYDYELKERCEADDEEDAWDRDVVDRVIAAGPTKGSQVLGISGLPGWVLSGMNVGAEVNMDAVMTEGRGRYRIFTIYYKASSMGGVPALFRTIVADGTEEALHHCCARDAHGEYPMLDYVREPQAEYLWDSRGVGEVTLSEQVQEERHANFLDDNASMKIKPPLNVPMNQSGGRVEMYPGKQIPSRRAGDSSGISKIEIAGESRDSIEAIHMTVQRAERYWLLGKEWAGSVEQRNRWKRLGKHWGQALKRLDRMLMQTIAQYMPDDLLAKALGLPIERLSRDDIMHDYSLTVAVDMDAMDPKTMENRAKLMREYILAMDTQGLVDLEPLLRELIMTVNPRWGKLIRNRKNVQRDDQEDVVRVLTAALQGIDSPFVEGKDHESRAAMIQQLIEMPALDDKDQPMLNPQTGQPIPGRVARIMQENPDAAAAVLRRLKFEQFWAAQGKNAVEGRRGVKTLQQVAQ